MDAAVMEYAVMNASKPPCRVLLVEDDPGNAGWTEDALHLFDCDVQVVTDGAAAAASVADGEFNVVLMDWHMPVMDGIAATHAIRAFEAQTHRPRTPIVAVTASVMPEEKQRCLDAGMDAVLSKPFMLDELEDVIDRWARAPRAGRRGIWTT